MTIDIQQTLDLSFDPALFEEACASVKQFQDARGEEYLDAVLLVLVFRKIEKKKPGSFDRLMQQAGIEPATPATFGGTR